MAAYHTVLLASPLLEPNKVRQSSGGNRKNESNKETRMTGKSDDRKASFPCQRQPKTISWSVDVETKMRTFPGEGLGDD